MGEAVIKTAGKFPLQFLIHTVGSVWKGGECGKLYYHLGRHCTAVTFLSGNKGIDKFPKEKWPILP